MPVIALDFIQKTRFGGFFIFWNLPQMTRGMDFADKYAEKLSDSALEW